MPLKKVYIQNDRECTILDTSWFLYLSNFLKEMINRWSPKMTWLDLIFCIKKSVCCTKITFWPTFLPFFSKKYQKAKISTFFDVRVLLPFNNAPAAELFSKPTRCSNKMIKKMCRLFLWRKIKDFFFKKKKKVFEQKTKNV